MSAFSLDAGYRDVRVRTSRYQEKTDLALGLGALLATGVVAFSSSMASPLGEPPTEVLAGKSARSGARYARYATERWSDLCLIEGLGWLSKTDWALGPSASPAISAFLGTKIQGQDTEGEEQE